MSGLPEETLSRPAAAREPVDFLQRAIDQWPQLPGLRVQLADALLREGRSASAEQALRTAADEFPRSTLIQTELDRLRDERPGFIAPHAFASTPVFRLGPPNAVAAAPPCLREPPSEAEFAGRSAQPVLWAAGVAGLVIAACIAIAILHPWQGRVLVAMRNVPVNVAPLPQHAKPPPHREMAAKPAIKPGAASRKDTPPVRETAAIRPEPHRVANQAPAPVANPAPAPALRIVAALHIPAARPPAAPADPELAALPIAPFARVTVEYPMHSRNAAQVASRLAAALEQSGLPALDRPVRRTTPPSIEYFYAEDRSTAERVASLAGLGAPRLLANAAHGFVPPGTIRIAVPSS